MGDNNHCLLIKPIKNGQHFEDDLYRMAVAQWNPSEFVRHFVRDGSRRQINNLLALF